MCIKCEIVAKIYTPETSTSTAVNKFAPGEMLSCNVLHENGIKTLNLTGEKSYKGTTFTRLGSMWPTCVTSEKNLKMSTTFKDLVLLLIFNFSISVTNALPTTNEKMCVSTNLS